MKFLTGLAASVGAGYMLVQSWVVLERPVMELLLLGRVPGTAYVIDFDIAASLSALMLTIAILWQYRRYRDVLELQNQLLRAL